MSFSENASPLSDHDLEILKARLMTLASKLDRYQALEIADMFHDIARRKRGLAGDEPISFDTDIRV